MPSTLSTRSPKPSSDEPDGQPTDKKPVLGLSLAQITGGALAAMTAAFLGSTLGTGGTILGAAFASVVAGVAGAIYTASLQHTGKRVRSVFVPTEPTAASDPTGVLERIDETQLLPRIHPDQPSLVSDLTLPQPTVLQPPIPKPAKGRFALRAAFVAVAVFLLAGAGLTGYELLTGQAVSGGQGTTIAQVSEPQGQTEQPEPKGETPAPSASATEEPTAAPSTTAPQPVPTATEQPTPGPATSTPNPSETPGTPGASVPTQ